MNPDYEQQLEARVRRELDALGELPAPPALANQITRVLEQRAAAPWYRRAWPTWPIGLRIASLTVLLGAFVGLSFGAWELTRTITAMEQTATWFADAQALCRTVGVLGKIVCTFTGQLHPGVIVTGLALLFATSATCIGLGSACVRLALRPALNRI